jgi:CRP/FNR family cyclic AMP-dependent transcriptional regulator
VARKTRKTRFDPKVFLATVDGGRAAADYRKNEAIFSQGDPADAVFHVQKGKVKIVVTSEQGKEAVVAVLGTDEFFGEGCLIGQQLRLATASAMSESTVMRLTKDEMIRVLKDEPEFAAVFTIHLLSVAAVVIGCRLQNGGGRHDAGVGSGAGRIDDHRERHCSAGE